MTHKDEGFGSTDVFPWTSSGDDQAANLIKLFTIVIYKCY
jgi:hypothetical protein